MNLSAGADLLSEDQFLSMINDSRASVGLGALTVDGGLHSHARNHTLDMMEANEIFHSASDELLAAAGSGWSGLAENVGRGNTVDSLHTAFMNSSDHKKIILGDYNYVGIGTGSKDGRLYVTIVFMNKGSTSSPTTTTIHPTNSLDPADVITLDMGLFSDTNGHSFEDAIEWLASKDITKGCNPPTNDKFCPNDFVTGGEMAVFLVRALDYTDNGGGNLFIDDNGLFYENSADRLKTAKVTLGCNPPANDKYCGESHVTRGQMAAFLVRAMGYTDNGGGNLFTDDDGHIFENAIDKLGTAKVTLGCNPPDNDHFCPNDFVTRGQMAAFLTRALGLTSMKPPPR